MGELSATQVPEKIDERYRVESRVVFASLVRLLGDFDRAEEALQEAFAAAVEKWERDGVPANPRSWLVSAGRFKAIDAIRRRARFDAPLGDVVRRLATTRSDSGEPDLDDKQFRDDRLRLILTCCHPAPPPATQVALTLREVCGLKTEEVASAFLAPTATIAKRIVRGKAKIRDARIPYEIPSQADLPERLDAVLSVIYLVFTEGYSASLGADLCRRLGRSGGARAAYAEALALA